MSNMDEEEKEKILNETIQELVDQAFKDGIVDDKEWSLLNNIEISLQDYVDGLHRALLDGIITPEESMELENLKENILKDAEAVASEDGEIDEEEAAILHNLAKIIAKYRTT